MSQSKIIHRVAQRHPSAPSSSRRRKRTLVAALGIGVAVALSGCNDDTGSSGRKSGKSQDQDQDASSDAGQSADKDQGTGAEDPKAPSGDSTPSDSGASPVGNKPMVKGWQTQTSEKHHFRYDVPAKKKKWKLLDDSTALSYTDEQGQPIVVMTGAGNYREGGCASSPNPKAVGEAGKGQLATVGTTGGGKDLSLQENARNWAGNWGFAAYGGEDHKPKIKVSQATPWKQGGIEGYTAKAEVTVTHRPSSCVPPKAVVYSIAQELPDGTKHGWVIYADQGVPNALKDADIKKIMSTVRATEG